MIAISAATRCLVGVIPVDFRRGIDGFVFVVKEIVKQDPMGGALFVFRNRAQTAMKILFYDGQGYWLCHKRLSQGRFRHWPGANEAQDVWLCARELQVLLWNGDPSAAAFGPEWKKLPPPAL